MRAMSSRRTFLKLLGIAAGATGIVHYAEPIQQIAQVVPHHDWVEDRGDFYVVRVPDLKMFANEQLKKPTIFILGAGAILKSVAVEGFCNIAAPEGGSCSVATSMRARWQPSGPGRPSK